MQIKNDQAFEKSPDNKLKYIFLACRPKHLSAAAVPVIVGSCLGFAVTNSFSLVFFILALFSMMALQAGANVANDYFDHISKNDWINKNFSSFSGGARYIQNGILSPKSTLLIALLYLITGAIIGLVIVFLSQSLLIAVLGIIGLAGGFFYTAPPLKFGYRCVGEILIGLLFGLLPVYGAYYLQTRRIDFLPMLPAIIISLHIFLVIFINEFPDVKADATVNKRTLVVTFGLSTSIWIYRIALTASFVLAAAMLFQKELFFSGLFYFAMLPFAAIAIKLTNKKNLTEPGNVAANKITILTHGLSAVPLIIGFFVGR